MDRASGSESECYIMDIQAWTVSSLVLQRWLKSTDQLKQHWSLSKPIKTSNKQLPVARPTKKITILSSFQNIQPSKQAANLSQNINQPPSTPTNHLQPMDVQLFSDSESLNSFTSHPKSSTDSFARCPKRNATPLTGQAEQWFVAPVGTEWYGEMLGNQLVFKSTISLSNDMS